MGVRILEGNGEGDSKGACFYCSTTDWAFGPLMGSREEAEEFLKWLPTDPRDYKDNELEGLYGDFVRDMVCECGEVRTEFDAERKATDMHAEGCMCGDDGGGDCEWCMAKQHYLDRTEREGDESRFVCVDCLRQRARKQSRHMR